MLCRALAVSFVAAFAVLPAFAQNAAPAKPPSSAQAAQQELMKTCNADASRRGFKGQARQDYMSACLSGKANQNTLMKACNAQATQDKLTADTRKNYVNGCLKKSG